MLSYQYKYPSYNDKTFSRPSYLYKEDHCIWKVGIYIETRPKGVITGAIPTSILDEDRYFVTLTACLVELIWPHGDVLVIVSISFQNVEYRSSSWIFISTLLPGECHGTPLKWALVQIMAWRHQAASYYLTQCWRISMTPYGVTRPLCVNEIGLLTYKWFIYVFQSFGLSESKQRYWSLRGLLIWKHEMYPFIG